ncbi:MAG: hypothetical protein NPIRA02_08810 [Nitrospirales bacterium]|nr:MAG: hypothetical protein NPIRA02_08810 [Nitrospirales bacterium]
MAKTDKPVIALPNVETFGWDTVYAASFPVVNKAIMAQKSFPTSFHYKDKAGVTFSGTWKSWQLCGGSGQYVQMECIVESGTAKFSGQHDGNLKDASLKIQVTLQQFADSSATFTDPTAKKGSGTAHVLKVNNSAHGGDPIVSVLSSQYPNVTGLLLDLLDSVFRGYFCEHIGEFNHTFATMMLNAEADKGDFNWLKPSAYSYAVAGPVGGDISEYVFGLLCMVDGGKIYPDRRQQQAVDDRALQGLKDGANSAFLISAEKFTEHMLFRGAMFTIQGSKAEDFKIRGDGVSISNVKAITWGRFQTDHGVIAPRIDIGKFTMRVEGDHILLELVDVHYEPTPGITVHMTITQRFGYQSAQRGDGKYVFIPDENTFGSPNIVSTVDQSSAMSTFEEVTMIVGTLVGAVLAITGIGEILMAGATVAEEVAGTAVEVSAEVIESATEEAGENVVASAEETAADSADEGAAAPGDPNQVQKGSFLLSAKARAWLGLAVALGGNIPTAGMLWATSWTKGKYDNIPALNEFVDNCVGATQWPMMADAELVSAELRKSLVMGMILR